MKSRPGVSIWVFLGGVVLAFALAVLCGLVVYFFPIREQPPQDMQRVVTIIAAYTPTAIIKPAVVIINTPAATAKSTVDKSGIATGVFVQISGTGNEGLRLRAGPGVTQTPLFLGMEAEVFQVKDGPKDVDGFTWWYLTAPYDSNRSGWAASKYLAVVSTQP